MTCFMALPWDDQRTQIILIVYKLGLSLTFSCLLLLEFFIGDVNLLGLPQTFSAIAFSFLLCFSF